MDRSLADPAAVAAMVAGDPAGLEAVYRRYADRLYGYARSIVDDAETAADVVQDTFVIAAERARQLRDPARLASWLYAIARNECLGRLRARKRTVMLAESHEPVVDTDPGRAVHAAQVRELVHAASAGMNEGDREVFELTVRHGLSAAELGQVLGVSDKHAHARISRARTQFEGALGALVLARDGRGRCGQLDDIMGGWDGTLTGLLRKRIERHARDCDLCSTRRRERMNPQALLAGYAALPFLAVATQLWEGVRLRLASTLGSVTSSPAAPSAPAPAEPPTVPMRPGPVQPSAVQPGPVQPGPAPVPVHAGEPTLPLKQRSTKGVVVAAALAVLLMVAGAVVVRLLTLDRPATPVAAETTSPPASGSASPSPPPVTTTATATPPAPPPPPPPFTVTATAQLCAGPSNELIVHATASLPLAQARVFYQQPPGTATRDTGMAVSGSNADVAFSDWSFAPEVRWWIVATATDGRTDDTSQVTTTFAPC